MKRRISVFIMVVCLIAGCLSGVVMAEETNTLTVFHVNDIHGYAVESSSAIGYAKLAGYVADHRESDPNTLFLDAGDVFQGNVYAAFDKGVSLTNILNTVGLDAMTGGNSEYMLGASTFAEKAGQLDYKVLGANVVLKGTADLVENVEPYTEFTTDSGVTVGVIGITTPDSLAGSTANDYDYIDAVESAEALVETHRNDVDVLIGLVHLGVNGASTYEVTSEDIANACPELDVIIDGHSHDVYDNDINGVKIVQTGSFSANLGELTFTLDDSNNVTGVVETLHSYEELASQAPKADTKEAADDLMELYETSMSEVVGSTDVFLEATRDIVRTRETNMGNLFTDSMREYTDADAAFAVAGGIGGDIEPGDITRGNILTMARIESTVVTIDVKGSDIIEALNDSVASYPQSSGNFYQVSGITFKFDPALESDRVFAVTVGSEPLDEDATYTVACFDGMFTSNPGLMNGTFVKEWVTTADTLLWYFDKHSPVSPELEGRITAVGSTAINEFDDINVHHWYYDFVSYAYDNGLLIGTSDNKFEPDTTMSRGMFATVIYRIAESLDEDMTPGDRYFNDVNTTDYYYDAITWAYNNGIIEGVGDSKFEPDSPLTREQAVTILGRMIEDNEESIPSANYKDGDSISNWAKDHVDLLTHYGLIDGYTDGTFRPQNNLNRAEASKILSIFYFNVEVAPEEGK